MFYQFMLKKIFESEYHLNSPIPHTVYVHPYDKVVYVGVRIPYTTRRIAPMANNFRTQFFNLKCNVLFSHIDIYCFLSNFKTRYRRSTWIII